VHNNKNAQQKLNADRIQEVLQIFNPLTPTFAIWVQL